MMAMVFSRTSFQRNLQPSWGVGPWLLSVGRKQMRKFLVAGLALCAVGALWKIEEEEDGVAVAMAPFLAALAIEAGIFLLRRHQTALVGRTYPKS
jgi:hypothetical protein